MWPLYSRLSERSTAQDWRQCRVVEGTVFQDGMVLPLHPFCPAICLQLFCLREGFRGSSWSRDLLSSDAYASFHLPSDFCVKVQG